MSYQLEICAFNFVSALNAAKYPIARIELCEGFEVGGTTPSYGLLTMARERIAIPIYPIIRPRGGDFLYSDDEFEIILRDIELCKKLGFEGVSTGIQLDDGSIDVERMKIIADTAYPMGITCHRVFDSTPDPIKALDTLIELNVERVLTSGQKSSALEGANLIKDLVDHASGRIEIMAGAGISSKNIQALAESSNTHVFHATAKKMVSAFRRSSPVQDNGFMAFLDEDELKSLLFQLNVFFDK